MQAETVYRWHIEERIGPRMKLGLATDNWKRTTEDYIFAAINLLDSMRLQGFKHYEALPIDPEGELLGGAHRLACALALGLPWVCAVEHPRLVWAPSWGRAWFVEHGMKDLARLDADWDEMKVCDAKSR